MSDTASRNPTGAPRMLADALLRSVAGTTALLQVAGAGTSTNQSEVGLVATAFAQVAVSPVALRRLEPDWQKDGDTRWELLVSATGVSEQVNALDLASAESLFAMTLAVMVGAKEYRIESVASNEVFGQVYLYRLRLREGRAQAL